MIACIGEPISWPRLERYASAYATTPAGGDPAIAQHLAQCPACRQCLDEIARDLVALPVLVAAVAPVRRARWWWFALPVAVAAALALLVVRPRGAERPNPRDNVATIKGVGEVTLGLVRERAGAIREDAATFAPGDRWKAVITCAPGRGTWVDVAVVEAGGSAADHPLDPARIACGNRVVVPGAFELTGRAANRVCVRVAAERAPARISLDGPRGDDVACVVITPE